VNGVQSQFLRDLTIRMPVKVSAERNDYTDSQTLKG